MSVKTFLTSSHKILKKQSALYASGVVKLNFQKIPLIATRKHSSRSTSVVSFGKRAATHKDKHPLKQQSAPTVTSMSVQLHSVIIT